MTVPSTERRAGPYTGTGALVSYTFSFKVFAVADLRVTVAPTSGAEFELVDGSTMLVSLNANQDSTPGGSVQYAEDGVAAALPVGYTLVIDGENLEFSQDADLPQGGAFNSRSIEQALDRLVMMAQILRDKVSRVVTLAVTADSVATSLPPPSAASIIGWDASAAGLRNYPLSDGVSIVGVDPDDLANPALSTDGAAMVGYSDAVTPSDTSTVANKLWHLRHNTLPSVADYLTVAQIATIESGLPNTIDLTSIIQSLITLGRPFRLIPGGYHYCAGKLTWKTGSIMIGSMCGVIPGSGDDQGATVLAFDSTLTTVGIELNSVASNFMFSWGIQGVTISTTNAVTGRASFKGVNLLNTGTGCYNFFLRDVKIQDCQYGWYADDSFFAFEWTNVAFVRCYKAVYKSSTGAVTSGDVKWLKISKCFHGLDLTTVTYNRWDVYYDNCGYVTTPWNTEAPSNEMPVLQKFNSVTNFLGTVGVENSAAILTWAQNYSSVDQSIHYYAAPASLWQKSTTRISNIAEASQALIRAESGCLVTVRNMVSSFPTPTYPAASTSDPSYFVRAVAGSDTPRVVFENCFLNLPSYCVAPSTDTQYITMQDGRNNKATFGATNITTINNFVGFENGRLRVGVSTVQDYMQLQRVATFTDGDECLRVTGATGSSSVIFRAVNGSGGNTAVSAMRVPASSVTSRAINAGGTVNASGADYAEYMTKCGNFTVPRGAVVGINASGQLTNVFADAIRFAVKSSDPSLVGNDTWAAHIPLPPDDATPEEKAAYAAAVEAARQAVDRISFCGQVPVNVLGASPGDYIVPAPDGAGIKGSVVSANDMTLQQFMRAVGQVIAIEDDGRARIIVRV